jgi:hypothetical protein
MSRATLPNRRPSETFRFIHDGHAYTATVSRFPDGRAAEVFLSSGKAGTAVETAARDAAVAASIALQHGAPLDVLAHAMTKTDDGGPAGPLGKALELMAG